ncbi:hypothetical protein [Desulfitobacterium sp. AusDCA]|uniref:hypothetical protein n=1 Tax=Desulfitobacterium sp. AusDCA TaxID=3240383 RepID=UPI003DA73C51
MSGKLSRTVLKRGKGSRPFPLVDYTSREYRQELGKYHIPRSMGHTRSCFDNARMESFFAALKKDLIYQLPLYKLTREERVPE